MQQEALEQELDYNRMGIGKYFNEVKDDFEIYGLKDDTWIEFNDNIEFDAFVVKRINK